jgi:glyoxylase-like metal-dependent hydrolase (beta-lactamase superfamily II)
MFKRRNFFLVVALVAVAAAIAYYVRKLFETFHTTPTGQIDEGLYTVSFGLVNMYLYTDGEHTIAIDTGVAGDTLGEGLAQLGIAPDDVTHVFLTHSDVDHAGGLGTFPNAHVYLGREEAQMIKGATRRFPFSYNADITRPYTLLDDGEVVTVGSIEVKAIATPGHTPGHTAYLVNGDTLFVGDLFGLTNGQARLFPGFIGMDAATQAVSAGKLAKLEDVKWMCTGHSGYTDCFDTAMLNWRT